MKIIFLDFDGVMNNARFIHENGETYHTDPIDPKTVEVLNDIIAHTGAVVVISSSWRLFWGRLECSDALRKKGFAGLVVGCTPRASTYGPHRGHEIQEYLDSVPLSLTRKLGDVTHFVILDDDSDMCDLKHKLVQTDFADGLTHDHVPAIMNHLM